MDFEDWGTSNMIDASEPCEVLVIETLADETNFPVSIGARGLRTYF